MKLHVHSLVESSTGSRVYTLRYLSYNRYCVPFAEQTGEAIHAKFKPTWAHFKRDEEHPEHGRRMLAAVTQFGGRRISLVNHISYIILVKYT